MNNLKRNCDNINVIFLYGPNLGLVDLLYKECLEILKIDVNDPFSVSKIDGNQFKETPSILQDNISTLSMFTDKRFILLDLIHVSINKNIENIILDAVKEINCNYLLIIKAENLKQNSLVKYFQNCKKSNLVPCYEENSNNIFSEIKILFKKHNLFFKDEFIKNLILKFNSDSLSIKMEMEKLDNFLFHNKNVTEELIFSLISNNSDINLDKVVRYCTDGYPYNALSFFDRIYENQSTSITLIRMFTTHFKLIEKILLHVHHGKSIINVIEKINPPIFFKKKAFIINQCKLWNLKSINVILLRLIELELKCKLNHISEKTLMSQFILSTSILSKNKIKT